MSSNPLATGRFVPLEGSSVPEVRLRNWPLVDGGWWSVAVVVLTLLAAFVAAQVAGSLSMGTLAAMAIMASMYRFWLPVRYVLRRRGIEEQFANRILVVPWRSIQSCRVDKHGVLITYRRYDRATGREATFFVEWHEQRPEVLEAINFYCRTSIIMTPASGCP